MNGWGVFRVFYTAVGYKSETILEASSPEAARAKVEAFERCVAVTSVRLERKVR